MPRLFALLLLLSAACRTPPLDYDGGIPGTVDLAISQGGERDLAVRRSRDLSGPPTSCCGKVGNPGNELGVGRFCQGQLDCSGIAANFCAAAISANLTFCTKSCVVDGGVAQCGSGAQCQCATGQCACVPGECTMPPPGC